MCTRTFTACAYTARCLGEVAHLLKDVVRPFGPPSPLLKRRIMLGWATLKALFKNKNPRALSARPPPPRHFRPQRPRARESFIREPREQVVSHEFIHTEL